MNSSTELKDLAAAMAKVQAVLKPALKDSNNPFFKSKYADLQSCWNACRDALTQNGLSVIQTFRESATGECVTVSTTLLHASGQWISGDLTVKPAKADPQGMGSAATYARRYSLAAIVGLVADEDDDGNAATHAASTKQPATLPAGATAVPALCGKENRNILECWQGGSDQEKVCVKRILKKYEANGIGSLTDEQATKGIAWARKELGQPF